MTTQLSQSPRTTTIYSVAVSPGFTDWTPVPRDINTTMLSVMQSKFDGRLAVYWEPPVGSEEHGRVLYYANPADALHYCKAHFIKQVDNSNLILKQIQQLLKV